MRAPVFLLVLLLAAGACSGGGGAAVSQSEPTPSAAAASAAPPSETTASASESESERVAATESERDDAPSDVEVAAPDTPEAAAIAAYERSWASLFEAANPANPQHPALFESFTGVAAETMINIVIGLQQAGHYAIGEMETHPTVVSASNQLVSLRDCTIEHSVTYEVGTDAIVEDEPNPPGLPRVVEVTNQDGTWRVSFIDTPDGTCTP